MKKKGKVQMRRCDSRLWMLAALAVCCAITASAAPVDEAMARKAIGAWRARGGVLVSAALYFNEDTEQYRWLETQLADAQKTAQKKENPNMVATKGLYKMVRCPNYFGEIVFWTGVFVAGISVYQTAWQWIVAILALICITYIMFNGAQRLEAAGYRVESLARIKSLDDCKITFVE